MRTRGINLLVDGMLPPEMRDPNRVLDAKGIEALLSEVALKHPDKYPAVVRKLGDIGRMAAWRQGRTLGLDDIAPVLDRDAVLARMDAEVKQLRAKGLPPEEFSQQRSTIWVKYSDLLEKLTLEAAKARNNDLAKAIVSGSRGKPAQLKMMVTTPGVYADHRGEVAPMFVRNSYTDGLRPAEYLASTFGARFAVISTKVATARGGDWSKIAAQATAPLVVTTADCGTTNGIDVAPDDVDRLRYRVLARPSGKLDAGTPLNRRNLVGLGPKRAIVRSVMTCEAPEGVCAKCYGTDAQGRLPGIGDAVGVTAANALGEPITQSSLNTKHLGGAASGKKEFSGLDTIVQFSQAPEEYPDRAVPSEVDGMVDAIEEAPQGGQYVTIGSQQHYVPPGFDLRVKVGDTVEAGDFLSDGLENPADVVRLRGLGQARRLYAERFKRILDDSGMKAFPRNVEMLARGAIDHVRVEDADGVADFLPDDVVRYSEIVQKWNPPATARPTPVKNLTTGYLVSPVLHYTVGTRVTPSLRRSLEEAGWDEDVMVDDAPPPFVPEMVRLRVASHANQDWLARQHTSYLKANLHESAERGLDTDTNANVHFAPRLAVGTDFGANLGTTGKY